MAHLLFLLTNLAYCLPVKSGWPDHRAAMLAKVSYCPDMQQKGFASNYLSLSDFSRPTADEHKAPAWSAAFDSATQEIVVMFKGSSSEEDWIRNINVIQEFIFAGIGGRPAVHRGFLKQAIKICREVDGPLSELIQKYPNADIHFVGHSQGGALAMIVPVLSTVQGVLLHLRVPPTMVKVTTFGAPAVGNRDWIELYKSKGFQFTRRIVNALDVVPKILAPLANFYHYEDELICVNDDLKPPTYEMGRGKCNSKFSPAGILVKPGFVENHVWYFGIYMFASQCEQLGRTGNSQAFGNQVLW